MREEPYKILIVEDSPTQAMHLKFLLEEQGYHVNHAPNGKAGLDAAREIRPDLVISDVMMPVMDGYEMCRHIKNDRKLRALPVILLTTLSEVEDLLRGLDVKADCYVTKPFRNQFLLFKVDSLLSTPVKPWEDETVAPLDLSVSGKPYTVTSSRRHILNVLLTVYENAVFQNRELTHTQEALENLNEQLSEKLCELGISEERFRSLVMTIPDIVYRIDGKGHFTFINKAIQRLGYDPEELVGRHFSEIVLASDVDGISREKVLSHLKDKKTGDQKAPKLFDERRTDQRKTTGLEIRLRSKHEKCTEHGYVEPLGDEAVTVEVNSSGMYEMSLKTKQKIFIGTVGVIRDISLRKKIEQDLTESEARMRTIFDNASAGIMVIEPDTHTIVDANPMALQMLNAAEDAVIGSECHQYVCPAEKGKCPITDLKETVDNSERVLITTDGDAIPILKTVASIILDGKPHLIESFVDISKLKKAEKALKNAHDNLESTVEERTSKLKKSQAQLIQAEKLGALGTLTAGIAHELNNPLMGMMNFIQYCVKHTPKDSKTYKVLQDTERETLRCAEIVKNLLTFSRMEREGEEKYQRVNCLDILERVFRLLAYRIDKENITVLKNISEKNPDIWAKPSTLQQVFLNLIGNALDALKNSERKEIHIAINPNLKSINVTIEDTGEGIDEEHLPKIYDPFFTTKPVGKGTGMGLSVCRSVIEEHGGRIECKSDVGKGTMFEVSLPIGKR